MELKLSFSGNKVEAGCDEAGRGCLAGPVVAAAVILPDDFENSLLNDSKKLSKSQRELLEPVILREAVAYGIGIVDNQEIDKMNILNASFEAMHRAIAQLKKKPELLLIDGNRFKAYKKVAHECIIKGDGKFLSIAAASILAKVHRDRLMAEFHEVHPEYGWNTNQGYPTTQHREAIRKFGSTSLHRQSFKLLPDEQLEIEF